MRAFGENSLRENDRFTKDKLASSLEEASQIAKEIGHAGALKVMSPQILHMTEAEAYKLNIADLPELKETYDTLLKTFLPS